MSFDGGKAQMEAIERRNRQRLAAEEILSRPIPKSGKYFVNADDLSERNLGRGYHAMASDLDAMVRESREMRRRIRGRIHQRGRNFVDSGGKEAFTPQELERQQTEGTRLALNEDTLTRIIDDGTALAGCIGFARDRSGYGTL